MYAKKMDIGKWIERLAIILCSLVCVFALFVMSWAGMMLMEVRALGTRQPNKEENLIPETTMAMESITETTAPENVVLEMEVMETEVMETEVLETEIPETTAPMVVETQPIEVEEETIVNLQENWSNWFLSNDNTDTITIWKKSDNEGNLLIALKDENGQVLSTFKYEGMARDYQDWILCDYYFEKTTTQDIIDVSFVAYHEVGGRNAENVQAQAGVVWNRKNSSNFPNTVRGVITAEGQYSSARMVTCRALKSDNYLEEEDLEKCFKEVLLVAAGEWIEEIPTDVVFAAPFKQGRGVWKVIDGTYYCYGWV